MHAGWGHHSLVSMLPDLGCPLHGISEALLQRPCLLLLLLEGCRVLLLRRQQCLALHLVTWSVGIARSEAGLSCWQGTT